MLIGVPREIKSQEYRVGLDVCHGKVTRREVAVALQYPYHDALQALAA